MRTVLGPRAVLGFCMVLGQRTLGMLYGPRGKRRTLIMVLWSRTLLGFCMVLGQRTVSMVLGPRTLGMFQGKQRMGTQRSMVLGPRIVLGPPVAELGEGGLSAARSTRGARRSAPLCGRRSSERMG